MMMMDDENENDNGVGDSQYMSDAELNAHTNTRLNVQNDNTQISKNSDVDFFKTFCVAFETI